MPILSQLRQRNSRDNGKVVAAAACRSERHDEPGCSCAGPRRTARASLASLPPEIHLLIAQHLSYPDALSLKHTCRYFYYTVDTGIRLKVDWLIERRTLHLDCPRDRQCDLGSDSKFCRGSIRLLMQRRREHIECESKPDIGCIVYGTRTCPQRRKLSSRLKRALRIQFRMTVELWNVLLALAALLVGLWMAGYFPMARGSVIGTIIHLG